MVFVYIITREGRSYNTKGLTVITEMLKDDYGVTDELSFFAGWKYNDPMVLADKIESCEVAVALSLSDKIAVNYCKNGMPYIAEDLRDPKNAGKTSWEIISEGVRSAENND